MPRIVIADDHMLVRQSVAKALRSEPGYEIVGEASTGRQAIEVTHRLGPDVLLLDIGLPDIDGLAVAAELQPALPELKIVFLSMHDDDASLRRAVNVHAAGFVPKTGSIDELLSALRTVIGGGSYLSPSIAGRVMELAAGRGSVRSLTDREQEILELLTRGARPADIADKLFLSIKTVKNHLTNVYEKLNVDTAAQAVAAAYRRGLVSQPPHPHREHR